MTNIITFITERNEKHFHLLITNLSKMDVQIEKMKAELSNKLEDQQEKLNDEDFSHVHEGCKRTINKVEKILSVIERIENNNTNNSDKEFVNELMEDTNYYSYARTLSIKV